MKTLPIIFASTLSLEVFLILLLTFIPRLGDIGKDIIEACRKAPWLDLILSIIIWIPWLIGGLIAGGLGIVVALIAQLLVMNLWAFSHKLAQNKTLPKPCIAEFHNQRIGWWRNNIALWATTVVVPVFFLIRFAEIFVYPILIWALGFPKYNQNDWITVSRQKFEGLVGYDLIWCLYCDWMTGVYALGAEILRNVESFWCPIRFYDGKKCENCKIDFPDVEKDWVAADGTMEDVEAVLNQMYSGQHNSWFGHPERKNEQ